MILLYLTLERFHNRIHHLNCPKSCCAEVVYTIDARKLKSKSERHDKFLSPVSDQLIICLRFIFNKIIFLLARLWDKSEVLNATKEHLIIFKSQVSIVI